MSNVLTTEREVGSYFSDLRTSGFKNPEQYICLRYEIFKWFYICSPLVSWCWLMLHEGMARIIDLATAESAKNCFRIQIESISGRKGMTLLHPPGVFSDHVCGSG